MQISTRSEDFLIDTLELRGVMQILNETFTDPAIVKVLHGADSDVLWLQRDFGLYVVNMFDTGQASRVLGRREFHVISHSLQLLIKRLFLAIQNSQKSLLLSCWNTTAKEALTRSTSSLTGESDHCQMIT